MLFLKILRILNGIFVISVALSVAARIFPIFRNKRTVMVNLFVLGMAGILTSLLFKQFPWSASAWLSPFTSCIRWKCTSGMPG